MVFAAGKHELIVGPSTPAIVAADALLLQIEVQHGESARGKLDGVLGALEIVSGVMERIDAEQWQACGQQAHAVLVAQGDPAHIHLVAAFARLCVIGVELFGDCAFVKANPSVFAIDVGLLRSASEPGDVLKTWRKSELHPDPRELGQIFTARCEGGFNDDIAAGTERVGGLPIACTLGKDSLAVTMTARVRGSVFAAMLSSCAFS